MLSVRDRGKFKVVLKIEFDTFKRLDKNPSQKNNKETLKKFRKLIS